MATTMKAAIVKEAGADFEIVELNVPEPGPRHVRIKVEACGICHSDAFVKFGGFPGLEYPQVPGHEVVGVIEHLGDDVEGWKLGDRVGVGWHGGHCFHCNPCRHGDFIACQNGKVTGITFNGGYAEYMVAPAESLARVPKGLDPTEAAPLLCAGITVYNPLRHASIYPDQTVAVQGIGGLGHLAIQYASKLGHRTVAISGSPSKKDLAMELGADHFIAASEQDPAEALQELGGARMIIATAPNTEAISGLVDGLTLNGELVVVAAAEGEIEVSPMQLLMGRRTVRGWPSGSAIDSEDTLAFSAHAGVKPMVEEFALDDANEAFDRMMNNKARFRCVLVP